MDITDDQLMNLLQQILCYEDDPLDCGSCQQHIAEFAEMELVGKPLVEALAAVRKHLNSCPCCRQEYQALLEALREVE